MGRTGQWIVPKLSKSSLSAFMIHEQHEQHEQQAHQKERSPHGRNQSSELGPRGPSGHPLVSGVRFRAKRMIKFGNRTIGLDILRRHEPLNAEAPPIPPACGRKRGPRSQYPQQVRRHLGSARHRSDWEMQGRHGSGGEVASCSGELTNTADCKQAVNLRNTWALLLSCPSLLAARAP